MLAPDNNGNNEVTNLDNKNDKMSELSINQDTPWWELLAPHAPVDWEDFVDLSATIEEGAVVDHSTGPIYIGKNVKICRGAFLQGPAFIDDDCLLGNNTMMRGRLVLGKGCRIGYAAELKNAVLRDGVSVGPMCYVADSVLDVKVYLGAMVRTSNHRLDKKPVASEYKGLVTNTGMEKLGAFIGRNTSLGIQVIIYPGRIVPKDSMFAPRITIEKNLPEGRYKIKQVIESF